jgi:hypothetical protein
MPPWDHIITPCSMLIYKTTPTPCPPPPRLPNGPLPSSCATRTLGCISNVSFTCHKPRPSHPPPSFHHPNNTWCRLQILKNLIMQFSQASCHFPPLRSIFPPQHPVLTPSVYVLRFLVRDQVSHPHIQVKQYTRIYSNRYVFKLGAVRQNTLNWTAERIPWIHSVPNLIVNVVLVFYCCSHIFQLHHIFKGRTCCLNTMLLSFSRTNLLHKVKRNVFPESTIRRIDDDSATQTVGMATSRVSE